MGRTPIRAKDSPGFIANRLARPFTLESLRMLGEGVADAARRSTAPAALGGGFRMGPFELIDLIGLDVNLSVARSFYAPGRRAERWRPSRSRNGWSAKAARAQERPRLLRVRGRTPKRDPDPELGIEAPTFDDAELATIGPAAAEILPRLLAQIANEATFALEEGVGSPEDMNTAMRLGFNWPLGPIELTERFGAGAARRARSSGCGYRGRGLRPPRRRRSARLTQLPAESEAQLVDVAPAPVLAGLGRADDRVPGLLEMSRSRVCRESCRSSRCGRTPGTSAGGTHCIPGAGTPRSRGPRPGHR